MAYYRPVASSCNLVTNHLLLTGAISMARYLQFVAQAFCVGAIIVIVAIASRQVYLRTTAEADLADVDEEPATMFLIRCEAMHDRMQNRHSSADSAEAEEPRRARCRES